MEDKSPSLKTSNNHRNSQNVGYRVFFGGLHKNDSHETVFSDDKSEQQPENQENQSKNNIKTTFKLKSKSCLTMKNFVRFGTLGLLSTIWIIFTIALIINPERKLSDTILIIAHNTTKYFTIQKVDNAGPYIMVELFGIFSNIKSNSGNKLSVTLNYLDSSNKTRKISDTNEFGIIQDLSTVDTSIKELKHHLFSVTKENLKKLKSSNGLIISFKTNINIDIPIKLDYNIKAYSEGSGVLLAAFILFGMYLFIIFDIIHPTMSAMFASTMAIAALSIRNERPTMSTILGFIDYDLLMLLFSMMIIVSIFAQSGFFDYLSVFVFQITGGKLWPLIHSLGLVATLLTMILDCVTTILLMTPVVIRICEVSNFNPVPILIILLFFCNISGIGTPVGNPPNVIIIANPYMAENGINVGTFSLHMMIGMLFCLSLTYLQLRFYHFRDEQLFRFEEPPEILELRHEIALWKKTCNQMVDSYSNNELLVLNAIKRKVDVLSKKLNRKLYIGSTSVETYLEKLSDLKKQYPIKDKILLIKSVVTLTFIVLLFFLRSVPSAGNISLGFAALIGLMLLWIISEQNNMEHLLHQVEWSSLLFFAALFVMAESLAELGLSKWLSINLENLIKSCNPNARLPVALLMILWIGGMISAFLDNIPLTALMIKVVIKLSQNEELDLPLQPLVFVMAFACGLGGNGTLIAASSNIVCAGVAEQHDHIISFNHFMKIGIPVMFGTFVYTTIYLMFCHVLLKWNH